MNINEELIRFLDRAVTPFHAVNEIRKILSEHKYTELSESEAWKLQEGGRYFVVRNESSIIAFRIPRRDFTGFMIGASHSDSPNLRIKKNPEIVSDGYVRLNVEGYGGMLCAPWFDRPLSAAGRVLIRHEDRIITRLINIDRDLLMIPSLAIHMNREVNKGHEYNIQKEMLPVLGSDQQKGIFMRLIAAEAGVNPGDILGHDLMLYIREKGRIWGADNEYVSAPHLDDLQCGFGDLMGFLQAEASDSVPVFAVFDNEEIGSMTKQGAFSTFLEDCLKRIASVCGKDTEGYQMARANSFMISADNAHAVHPAYPEKADPVNRPKINGGIVLKYSVKYTTDGIGTALFREVCERAGVPVQVFTNRSDMMGGGTLGNISNSHVSVYSADIGLPQLAMHSPYETAGTRDTEYLAEAMKEFYSCSLGDLGKGNFALQTYAG